MLAEITIFDFNPTTGKIENKRKALIKPESIETAQELSNTNFNMSKEVYDKIFPDKIFSIRTTSGTNFLIDKNEYNDLKNWGNKIK